MDRFLELKPDGTPYAANRCHKVAGILLAGFEAGLREAGHVEEDDDQVKKDKAYLEKKMKKWKNKAGMTLGRVRAAHLSAQSEYKAFKSTKNVNLYNPI